MESFTQKMCVDIPYIQIKFHSPSFNDLLIIRSICKREYKLGFCATYNCLKAYTNTVAINIKYSFFSLQRNAHKILVGLPEEKRQLEEPRRR
jgi:hypothetical protein